MEPTINWRREAFVEAIRRMNDDLIIVLFGVVPWELFYAFDLLPIKGYGIDSFVIEEPQLGCQMMQSTLEYYRLDKCPFMHCADYFVVDDRCNFRSQIYQRVFDPIICYRSIDGLIDWLEDYTGEQLDLDRLNTVIDQSKIISQEIIQLQSSTAPPALINQVTYESQYLFDLDERIEQLRQINAQYQLSETPLRRVNLPVNQGLNQHFPQAVVLTGNACEGERHFASHLTGLDYLAAKYTPDTTGIDYTVSGCTNYSTIPTLAYKGEE